MLFCDIKKEYLFFKQEIDRKILQVMESGKTFFGKETESLESFFRSYTGHKHAIAVKNCTDAIILVLKKIHEKGMTIILPNFGAYPTAVACKNITDNIYYVDVDENFTIDINKLPDKIKNGIIIPVHLFGNACNMPEIMDYADRNNHIVIEDCAQSTGNYLCGHLGDFSVFSFYPTKPLASMGDGGMICTSSDKAKEIRRLAFYGQENGEVKEVGINSRIDEIQAGIINVKAYKYLRLIAKRQNIAEKYNEALQKPSRESVYHQYPVMVKDRQKVIEILNKNNIPFMIHYPKHVSEIPALSGINNEVGFRVAENIISLPIHAMLEDEEVETIVGGLNDIKNFQT